VLTFISRDYNFLDDDFYRENLSEGDYADFMKMLKELDIADSVIVRQYNAGRRVNWYYYINNLEEQLLDITLEQSVALLKFVAKADSNTLPTYGHRESYIAMLNNTPWLFDEQKNKLKPSDMIVQLLHPDYAGCIDAVRSRLDFKSFESLKLELDSHLRKTMESDLREMSPLDQYRFNDLVKSGGSLTSVFDKAARTEALESELAQLRAVSGGDYAEYDSLAAAKAAGAEYERRALAYLRQGVQEEGYAVTDTDSGFSAVNDTETLDLRLMDTATYKQEGYDFQLLRNGIIVEYIEVKGSQRNHYELSQTQYRKALELARGGGEKFRLILLDSTDIVYDSTDCVDDMYKTGRLRISPEYLELV
jgi:hypothetical protein